MCGVIHTIYCLQRKRNNSYHPRRTFCIPSCHFSLYNTNKFTNITMLLNWHFIELLRWSEKSANLSSNSVLLCATCSGTLTHTPLLRMFNLHVWVGQVMPITPIIALVALQNFLPYSRLGTAGCWENGKIQ